LVGSWFLRKLLGIVVLGLLLSGNAYARRYGEGDLGGLLIYALALLGFFAIGALISPIWELGKLFEKKKINYKRRS